MIALGGRRPAVVAPAGDRVGSGHRAGQHRRRGDPSRRLLAAGDADDRRRARRSGRRLQPHARAHRGAGDGALPGQRGSAPRGGGTAPRRAGARRAAGARARSQPAEGRVPRHALARASHAAQRDPRLDQAAARQCGAVAVDRPRAREGRAERAGTVPPDRGSARSLAHRQRQTAPGLPAVRPIALCTTAVESMRPAAESRGVTIERHFERTLDAHERAIRTACSRWSGTCCRTP